VYYTNIGLEKIKVHIRKPDLYNQKRLAHEQTKDLGVFAWVADMKPVMDHFHLHLHQGWCAPGYYNSLPSGSLTTPLKFVTAANTSVGVKTMSSDRVLGSPTPNWWSLLLPNPNTAPLIVTMMPWKSPEAIEITL
jgi:hypothetical protein